MKKATVTVNNKTGIHARPASVFAKAANSYKSDVSIEKDGKKSNAKSIISVLAMGIKQGTTINIIAEGEDEEKAVNELVALVESFTD